MARRNYAFYVAATIVTEKKFGDLTVAELCAAMRSRLDKLEARAATGSDAELQERSVFDCFDSLCLEKDAGKECKCHLCGGDDSEW